MNSDDELLEGGCRWLISIGGVGCGSLPFALTPNEEGSKVSLTWESAAAPRPYNCMFSLHQSKCKKQGMAGAANESVVVTARGWFGHSANVQ